MKIKITRNDASQIITKLKRMGQKTLASSIAESFNSGSAQLRLGIKHNQYVNQLKKEKSLYKKYIDSIKNSKNWGSDFVKDSEKKISLQKNKIRRLEKLIDTTKRKMTTAASGRTDKVSFVIPICKGEVLLQKRIKDGSWGLFGGHIDKGEKYKEAAVREFKEETGFDIPKSSLTLIGKHGKDKYFAFRTSKKFNVAPSKETKKAKWFSLEGIAEKKKNKVQPKLSRRFNKVQKFIIKFIGKK